MIWQKNNFNKINGQHGIAIVVLLAMLIAGWFVTPGQVEGWSLCLFKTLTQLDCPGCGLTRSFLSLARGEWRAALSFNPAGPPLYLLFGFFLVEKIVGLFREEFRFRVPHWLGAGYGVTVITLLMGSWLVKLSTHAYFLVE